MTAQALPDRETAALPASALILVGHPNVGKSALFGALTRSYVAVSNYPGTTVEVTHGRTVLDGASVPVMDTPGVLSFIPSSEDERVARDILLGSAGASLVAVADAKDLVGALSLALQITEMELPFVLCLNMMDEARERGFRIDDEALSERLGVPVVPTVAVQRKGLARVRTALGAAGVGRVGVDYPEAIERAVRRLAPLLPSAAIAPRALALMILAGDETLVEWLRRRTDPGTLREVEDIRQELRRRFREPVVYQINRARLRAAEALARGLVSRAGRRAPNGRAVALRLETLAIHPVWSLPILGAVLYLVYLFVGKLGAGTLVDLMENGLFGGLINPAAVRATEALVPWPFLRDLLVGEYGLVTMALTYALALILPIVTTFFIAFGLLEDSGYLPRLAVVLNRPFKKMGLNGKAVLPMVLGLGCDTMATLTARILPTRKERLIVILLLSLGVPCSAQLAVILALLGSVSALAVGIWAAVVVGVIVLVGSLAARVLPGRGSDFIATLPPMRRPRLSNILLKTAGRVEWYLREAVPLFLLGSLVLFVTDRLGALGAARRAAEPVVSGWLGLPVETAEAFIIGFLRRDFGAAGLYQLADAGRLDAAQILVAAVTITLFLPCIAQFFMTVKERGWRAGLAIAGFVFAFALLVGGALNALLRVAPIPLG